MKPSAVIFIASGIIMTIPFVIMAYAAFFSNPSEIVYEDPDTVCERDASTVTCTNTATGEFECRYRADRGNYHGCQGGG